MSLIFHIAVENRSLVFMTCLAENAMMESYVQAFGLLVLLGFAISDFTPAAYQRHRL